MVNAAVLVPIKFDQGPDGNELNHRKAEKPVNPLRGRAQKGFQVGWSVNLR